MPDERYVDVVVGEAVRRHERESLGQEDRPLAAPVLFEGMGQAAMYISECVGES